MELCHGKAIVSAEKPVDPELTIRHDGEILRNDSTKRHGARSTWSPSCRPSIPNQPKIIIRVPTAQFERVPNPIEAEVKCKAFTTEYRASVDLVRLRIRRTVHAEAGIVESDRTTVVKNAECIA